MPAGWMFTAASAWKAARKRPWLTLGVSALAALAGGLVAQAVPDRYAATARLYVETQTALKPLLSGLTYAQDVDQQVQMLARTLVSRANVEQLVDSPALAEELRASPGREALIARLMSEIRLVPAGFPNLYDVGYRSTSPARARQVVEATLELFGRARQRDQRRDSQDAGRFVEAQLRDYEARLAEADQRVKDFKLRHFAAGGTPAQDHYARMAALTDEVARLRVDLGAVERARDSYRRELSAQEPALPPEVAPRSSAAPVQEAQALLEAQRKHVDDLKSRFTEEHPELVAARRQLRELEAEARARQEAEDRALARVGKAGRAATNPLYQPLYQRLRVLLAEAEGQAASLQSQLADKQAQLAQVRAAAARMPQLEAELAGLVREQEQARRNVDAMRARRESADLGRKLDESAQFAELRVIDPPRSARWPAFPGRLYLALLALLLAPLAGIGAALAVERLRPTLDDARGLRALANRPVLGVVRRVESVRETRRRRLVAGAYALALAAALGVQAAWLGLHVVPPVLQRPASAP